MPPTSTAPNEKRPISAPLKNAATSPPSMAAGASAASESCETPKVTCMYVQAIFSKPLAMPMTTKTK
ncbi:MAG: hypothetical protein F4Z39_14955 [Chloroflexi bacterium]|nr:hypothetical protein [Chloroflexota bacterium]